MMHCLIHVPELMNVKRIGRFENMCRSSIWVGLIDNEAWLTFLSRIRSCSLELSTWTLISSGLSSALALSPRFQTSPPACSWLFARGQAKTKFGGVDKCVFCMFWASICHHFSIISSLFYTISHHLSSLYMFRIDLHACCIFALISGDLELLTSYLEEADLIMTNHSTKRSSRSFKISKDHSTPWSSRGHHYFTTSLDPEVECLHPITWPSLDHITRPRGRVSSPSLPDHYSTSSLYLEVEYHHHHHSTAYSMTSFRAFFIPHSTRHSSTRKKRRLQLFTRPPTRPHGPSTVLNPSQYFVVLSIRVSEYLAISSMYFTFSQQSF
jgi:hypothetical protein